MLPSTSPTVLIVQADEPSRAALSRMCEERTCTALFAPSLLEAYGMLAETYDRIALIVLDVTTDAAGAIAFRELQLDAPRVATIPTMVISDRPLTERERQELRPSSIAMKPLAFVEPAAATGLSAR